MLLAHASAIVRLVQEVRDEAERKVPVKLPTLSVFHFVANPVPVNFTALWNVYAIEVTLATFHPLMSTFILAAPSKVCSRVVTEVVSQFAKPVPSNAVVVLNVSCIVVTLATFHLLMSMFIANAPAKANFIVVTEAVFHLTKSVPTNVLTFVLLGPLVVLPPAESRHSVKE